MRNKGEMEEKESGASEAEIASESHDGGSSDSGDDAVGEAVSHALEALVALDSEDLEYAMHELKQQVVTAQYAKSLRKLVEIVLEYDSADSPFAKRERKALMDLFERAAVIQHSVFKDNEWTLGPRREPCGANTTIELVNKARNMSVKIVFEWYWRNDEHEGFVEEFTLSIQDGEENSDGEGPGNDVNGAGEISYVALLEGTRSHSGQSSVRVCQEALQELEDQVLNTGASLQTVLRFLVLCTRMESRKCQGRAGSVTAGYDMREDAEAMRKFLCEFQCESLRDAETCKGANGAKRRSAASEHRKGDSKRAKGTARKK